MILTEGQRRTFRDAIARGWIKHAPYLALGSMVKRLDEKTGREVVCYIPTDMWRLIVVCSDCGGDAMTECPKCARVTCARHAPDEWQCEACGACVADLTRAVSFPAP